MRSVLPTALAALVVPLSSTAQDLERVCQGVGELQVGQWAEYAIQVPELDIEMTSRHAIVGTEDVEGQRHYRLELETKQGMTPMALQFLVPSYPYRPNQVAGFVMKMGDAPPMEMPPMAIASMQQRESGGDNLSGPTLSACEDSEVVGWEEVEVPAGTFRALHVEGSIEGIRADLWLSPDVPFGLVRMEQFSGQHFVLTGHGTDAVSVMGGRAPVIGSALR